MARRGTFVYSSEFLPFKGGVGRYTEDMAAMLASDPQARVAVFTETGNSAGYPDAARPYRVHRLPLALTVRHPYANILINAVTSLAALLRARLGGYRWFVATGKRSVYNAAFLYPLLRGLRVAVVLHGSEWSDIDPSRGPRGWRGAALRRVFLRMCDRADLVVIPNRFTISRFASTPGFAPKKLLLLHPIVDPERVRPDVEMARAFRERHFGAPALSVITIARITPRKGQDMVIRALGRLARETGAAVRYFVVGSGSYLSDLRALAESQGMGDRVVFLPGLGDTEAYSLLSLCDLFAMPNREHKGTFEGFGIAFLEANVLGVPALAGRSGGSTEAVEDGANGIVCDGDDPDDVYRALRRFHEDSELRERLRNRCRAVALERFSFARWKAPYREAFD